MLAGGRGPLEKDTPLVAVPRLLEGVSLESPFPDKQSGWGFGVDMGDPKNGCVPFAFHLNQGEKGPLLCPKPQWA